MYTDKVELTVLVPDDEEGFLMKELMEGTNGQAMTEKTEQCWFAETEEGIKIFGTIKRTLAYRRQSACNAAFLICIGTEQKPGFAK